MILEFNVFLDKTDSQTYNTKFYNTVLFFCRLTIFSTHRWTCTENKCVKFSDPTNSAYGTTLDTCNMLCGENPPLWPQPKYVEIKNKNSSTFLKQHIFLKIHAPDVVKSELEEASNRFLDTIVGDEQEYKLYENENQIIKLNIHVKNADLQLTTAINESYSLYCQKLPDFILVNLFADNYYGARHGLETLSQLIWYDTISSRFRILHDVKIVDQPNFTHRGLMLDVSRHYFPTELLKKALDAMAASKLNVFHLHISDSASFPLVLPNNKNLAFNGAYDEDSKYSSNDIDDLVKYARKRGIRTIMEIDAPSHITSEAWDTSQVLCDNPDLFRSTLNPDNPETLNTLQGIYSDLFTLGTDKETFHIGDDEVVVDCWKETNSAKEATMDIYAVWAKFTNDMMERVKLANNGTIPKNIVLWSSPLTDRYLKYLSYQKDLVVQYWFGQFKPILDNGYKIIFSTVGQWYLDCGFGPWKKNEEHGSCDPYTDWKKFYKYRPWKDYSNRINQVLGGEVCLWTEQVSTDDLETRLWPRAAAFAERVWSDPPIFDQNDVFRRIDFHSRRLKNRGFRVAAIWPQICSLHPDKC